MAFNLQKRGSPCGQNVALAIFVDELIVAMRPLAKPLGFGLGFVVVGILSSQLHPCSLLSLSREIRSSE